MTRTSFDPYVSFGAGRSSVRLGSVRGIDVRVHYLWFLLPLLTIGQEGLLVLLLATFVAVFLHELGHSVAAQHYGIRVVEITFWPLGGMARMAEIPEDPRIETHIALAGPMVNFVLAAASLLTLTVAQAAGLPLLTVAAWNFLLVNLMLGGFNLLPAFPMDGGRVLRAWLGRSMDWVSATEKAVRVGRGVAGVLVVASVVTLTSVCIVPLIGAFVWYAGAQELFAVRKRHGVSLFGAPGGSRAAERPAQAAWAERPSPRAEPPRSEPDDAPHEGHAPRRPSAWEVPDVPRSGGFSESDIASLERYHGRLGHPRAE